MKCTFCSSEIPDGATFCRFCGTKQAPTNQVQNNTYISCSFCGNPITGSTSICPKCGTQINYNQANSSSTNTEPHKIIDPFQNQNAYASMQNAIPSVQENIQPIPQENQQTIVPQNPIAPTAVAPPTVGPYSNFSDNTIQLNNSNNQKASNSKLIAILSIVAVIVLGCIGILAYISGSKKQIQRASNRNDTTEYSIYDEEYNEQNSLDSVDESSISEIDESETTSEEITEDAEEESDYSYPDVSNQYISSIEASSYLEEEDYDISHDADKIIDGDNKTAWCENANGDGIGETITISLSEDCVIHGIKILNGYQKSDDLYYKNSRPSSLDIYFSDGQYESINLTDNLGWQTFDFDNYYISNTIEISIQDVYPGSKYDDTLITEIKIY